jgi:acetyltransferase-like isoleucine patch superfamily enzyme
MISKHHVQLQTICEDPIRLPARVLTWLFTKWIRLVYPFAALGRGLSIHYTCELQNSGLIRLGDFVTVNKDVWLHAQLSDTSHGEPTLIVEDECFIGRRAHISAKNLIHLERGVMIAASVLIEDNSHEFSDVTRPIRYQGLTEGGRIHIGQGCWIGQGAVIVCNRGELKLGRNCVVGANTVVTRSAPPYSVLVGNPARIVKRYDPTTMSWRAGSAVTSEVRAGE